MQSCQSSSLVHFWLEKKIFSNFSWMFLNPNNFFNMIYDCSDLLDLINLQEQVKKHSVFAVWINCSSDFKNFENSQPSASKFKSFSRSLEQFFFRVGQNNFGNKIPFQTGYHCNQNIKFSSKIHRHFYLLKQ